MHFIGNYIFMDGHVRENRANFKKNTGQKIMLNSKNRVLNLRITLYILMIISYFVLIGGLLVWDIGGFILIAAFTLGAALVPFILPIVGAILLITGEKSGSVGFGIIFAWISFAFITSAAGSLPLKSYLDEGGTTALTSSYIAPIIFVSGIIFLASATIIFCIRSDEFSKAAAKKDDVL